MAYRHVWGKWNVADELLTSEYAGEHEIDFIDTNDQAYGTTIYSFDTYTLNGTNFVPTNKVGRELFPGGYCRVSTGKYFTLNRGSSMSEIYQALSGDATIRLGSMESLSVGNYAYRIRIYFSNYAKVYYAKVQGTTSYGNVSATTSGAYPTNNYKGNYWYKKLGYDCIDPSTVSYSTDAPRGGETIDITVTPRANTYGGTIKYKYEYSLDGGVTWTVANSGTTSTTVSVLIPAGSTQFKARVTASDNMGFTSTTAVSGADLTVTNNTAPIITCDTTALGEVSATFSVPYSVSDADGNTMTVTEKLDNTVLRSYTTTGGDQTLTVDADRLLRTLNGAHTLTITADDGNGGVTTHSISFTKAVYACSITLVEPLEADDLIRLMVMNIARSIPDDAIFQVFACNNGFDAEPTWEEITSFVLNGYNYELANASKTADKWGFNFKIIASRAPGGQGGYIESVSGGFEG